MKVASLLTPSINKHFTPQLAKAMKNHGFNLEVKTCRQGYKRTVRMSDAIVTWGVKMPQKWYDKFGIPILYLENGLICQPSGLYMDHKGWFYFSSIVDLPKLENPDTGPLEAHVRKHLGFELFQHGNPDGPIMFAHQNPRDASCRYHYPNHNKGLGIMESAIKELSERWPDQDVLIRPHPKFKPKWKAIEPEMRKLYWRPKWKIDTSPNVYETLKGCSRLVTISSTLVTEAAAMGLPVTPLGRGVWKGVDFDDRESVTDYLVKVFSRQISYHASHSEIAAHPSFRKFIHACKAATPKAR